MDLGGRSPLSNLLMLFYENTPAWQESYNSYATNATCVGTKFSYNIPTHPDAAIAVLHAKIDRVLFLLEDQQNDEYAGLIARWIPERLPRLLLFQNALLNAR